MTEELVLCVDDVKLDNHEMYLLKMVKDGVYEFCDIPIFISSSKKEYQMKVGVFVYRLDLVKDKNIIKDNIYHVKKLEKISDNKYSLITLYDKETIEVKMTNLACGIEEELSNKKFVRYDAIGKFIPNNGIYVLKQNEDGTVSIEDAPIVINSSLCEYQMYENSFFVFSLNQESYKYILDKNIIMELEPTGYNNKYNFIRVYEKGKVIIKKSNIIVHKEK